MVLIRRMCCQLAGCTLTVAVAAAALLTLASARPQAADAIPLLPNLVADPPTNASLEVSTTEGGLRAAGEAQLLLRFNGYIHNVGPGALDFRGSRNTPSEPMHAFQRIYDSGGGSKDEPSSAEFVFAASDGHEHWHLQRVARYSLWNSTRTAEAAPAQKVGFCLEDSEHVEPVGPPKAVYSEENGRAFCQAHQPEATSLFEGISAGWRDLYASNLPLQWVDASNVQPGEYWLREDVNPTGAIKEVAGANAPAYAAEPIVIAGFDALSRTTSTNAGEARTVALTSAAWSDSGTPTYTITAPPAHGTLSTVKKNEVTYTPTPGYAGHDAFTFAASDPNRVFPRSPASATVSINVIGPTASAPPALGGAAAAGRTPTPLTLRNGPRVTLANRTLTVSPSGTMAVKVACPPDEKACAGSVTLRTLGPASVAALGGASGHAAKTRATVLTLASGRFSVAGGHVATVRLHLRATARKLLAHRHVLRVGATIVAHDLAGAARTTRITVTLRLSTLTHAGKSPVRFGLVATADAFGLSVSSW